MGKLLHFPEPAVVDRQDKAERDLLGRLMLGLIPDEEIEQVRIGDFTKPKNRRIFQFIYILHHSGKDIDLVNLCEKAKEYGLLEDAGGAVYISSLTDGLLVNR